MKTTMDLEEYNAMKEKRKRKIKSKGKNKNTEKDLLESKKSKKKLNQNNIGGYSRFFRNNYKNYQYDYEEDFYEPY